MTVSAKRDLEQHEEDERYQLGDVAREDVGDETPDVVVDRAAFFDRVDDAREVVVGQDHVGRFFGDVRSRDAHGHTDVGHLQRGRVVHAVACHGDDVAHALEHLRDAHLVLGRDAGEEHVFCVERDAEFVVGHVVEIVAGDDAGMVARG